MMEKDVLYISSEKIDYISSIVNDGGIVPLLVSGNSMRPFISSSGDTVYLCKCNIDEIHKGMILLYRRGDKTVVLHRVKNIIGETYQMNGDAQSWCEYIDKNNIIAKVIKYTHKGKEIDPESLTQKTLQLIWRLCFKIRPYLFSIANKVKKGS